MGVLITRMTMKKSVWCVILLVVPHLAIAAVGTWRNYTSMKAVRDIVRAGDIYWAATSGGLFAWREGSSEFQRFTNAEGLRNVDLTAIAVDHRGDIWSGTSTGVIQIYSPAQHTWRYILDIELSGQTNKRVHRLVVYGDTVLVCTDFGVSVYDNDRGQFGDTYSRFGTLPATSRVSVYDAILHSGNIWVAVGTGQNTNYVAVASLANPNLLPPESWSLQTVEPTLGQVRSLAVFNGSVYAGTSRGLYWNGTGPWTGVPSLDGQNVIRCTPFETGLAVCTSSLAVSIIDVQNNVVPFGLPLPYLPTSIAINATHQPIIGSTNGGILQFGTAWESFIPNGPQSNQFISVAVDQDGIVWGASGYSGNGSGFYKYDGSEWKSFTTGNSPLPTNDYFRISIGCGGSVWASSWGSGVVEVPHGAAAISQENLYGRNVGMLGLSVNPDYIVISSVQCDQQGNTWMTINSASDRNILAVHKADDSWSILPLKLGSSRVNTLLDNTPVDRTFAVDASGNLWAASRDGSFKGVFSLGNRGTLDDSVDYYLTEANGLPSNDIKTIVVDRDNDVWIGTDRGIAIVLDPDRPTRSGAIAAYRPLNGLVINTIAVDALNQKWVGTNEGVILLSQDGTQQIASYTVESTGGKLIDNDVKSIAIDTKSGTVYFGSTNGLASLTTTGAAPKSSFDELVFSPNPFVVPNTTLLTVDGLVENSSIKVLSIDGRLVRNLTTPGGRIGFWDGQDDSGKDVATGVYIVVAYSEDGSKVATGKVAVVRR